MRSDDQFNALAANYASSPVHAAGPSLPVLLEVAQPQSRERTLDVATGTGHTALTFAPHVREVVGIDIAEKMLAEARRLAEEKGITNATFQFGNAEEIPFGEAEFDLVTARHAPHHFRDAGQFLKEVRRVLKPTGRFVMVDQISLSPEVSEWIHTWEQTRDRSHFLQRTEGQWQELATAAGLSLELKGVVPYRMTFEWWTKQAGCSPEQVQALVEHAKGASPAAREAFQIEFDDEGKPEAFTSPMGVFLMRPAIG